MVSFDRPHTISYLTSIATMSLSCTVFEIIITKGLTGNSKKPNVKADRRASALTRIRITGRFVVVRTTNLNSFGFRK